jgi:hypothetical protein
MRELSEHDKALIIDGIPDANLVLFCPGLQGRGSTLIDRSTNANNGTISGASWKRLPSGLWGLSFSGATHIVNCGDGVSLDITAAITLECWFKATAFAATQALLQRDDGTNRNYGLSLTTTSGKPYGGIWVGNNAYAVVCSTTLSANTFYHVAFTFDGTALNIYLNGVIDATPVTKVGSIDNDNVSFTIGARKSGDRNLSGQLFLPRVHNAALSVAVILRHFTRERRLFGV